MKKIFAIICITISIGVKAQIKSVSLYDLLTMAIPDSTLTNGIYDWSKGISVHPLAQWQNKSPKSLDSRDKNGKLLDEYYKDGSINLKLNNIQPGESGLYLAGNSKGYNQVQLSTELPQDYTLEKILGNKKAAIILLKKDEDTYFYNLKLPNKNKVWLCIFPIDVLGDGNKSLEIDCYFDYNDVPGTFKT